MFKDLKLSNFIRKMERANKSENKKDKDPFDKVEFFFAKNGDYEKFTGFEGHNALTKKIDNYVGDFRSLPSYEYVENKRVQYREKCSDYHLGKLSKPEKEEEDKKYDKILKTLKSINCRNVEEFKSVVNLLPLSMTQKMDYLEYVRDKKMIFEEYSVKHYFYLSFTKIPKGTEGLYRVEHGSFYNVDDISKEDRLKLELKLETGSEQIDESSF